MRKTIYSILDLFLDHEFRSVVIPSFCNETSGFPSRDYAKVVIKKIRDFIDENTDEMRRKTIYLYIKDREEYDDLKEALNSLKSGTLSEDSDAEEFNEFDNEEEEKEEENPKDQEDNEGEFYDADDGSREPKERKRSYLTDEYGNEFECKN